MGRTLQIAALAVLIIGGGFGIVAANVSWLDAGDADFFTIGYSAFESRVETQGDLQSVQPYSTSDFDDVDGAGLARAGGILWLIGLIVVAVTFLAAENHFLVDHDALRIGAAIGTAVAALLMLVALILLPIGLGQVAESQLGGIDSTWVFGLYAGILATACTMAAAVLNAVGLAGTTGFRLELADAPTTNFD